MFVDLTPAETSLCRREGRGEGKRKCSADDGKGKDMKSLSSRLFPVPIVLRSLAISRFNTADFYYWNTQREPLLRREIQTQSEELNLRKSRTYLKFNSLSLVRRRKSSAFGLGLILGLNIV